VTIRFDPRVTLGRAWAVVGDLTDEIIAGCPEIRRITPAGHMRRIEPIVEGIVVIALVDDVEAATSSLLGLETIGDVARESETTVAIDFRQATIVVRLATSDSYGTVLFDATGSPAHVQAITERRRDRAPCADEEVLYASAGLPFIPPELRHGSEEIDAAAAGSLPVLVERSHIRGDLHMHSTFSDGQDPMATMVAKCYSLGYEYIAITDHSENAGASRTLRASQVSRQRAEIEKLRDRYPDMTIFHGVEVDILENGRLDFSDRLLERFDVVLASLHNGAGMSPAQLTRLCLDAMDHPLVNVLSHPANRVVGHRSGYELDYDAVYAAAADTGTALEIDGAPSHLDLDGDHARAAAAAGARLVIDSDCHRASALERQMELGIGTARRGWVGPHHVLNTGSAEDVRDFVARKRAFSR
jgi:DNA polymerase (family 10)